MSFESIIEGLVKNATVEYHKEATNNPVVKSIEDNTARGLELDSLLAIQEAEKKELWNRLYELQSSKINEVREDGISRDRKELLKLLHMDQQIVEKVRTEMENVNLVQEETDLLCEIKYREKLELNNKHFIQLIQTLEAETYQHKEDVVMERTIVKEINELTTELETRKQEILDKVSDQTQAVESLKRQVKVLNKRYQKSVNAFIEFINTYYPPQSIDHNEDDQYDIKLIVEQLLNRMFNDPEDPYLPLVPGTYWKPYVETLIKSGCVKFKPGDSNYIRIEDYST